MKYLLTEDLRNLTLRIIAKGIHPNCNHETIASLLQQLAKLEQFNPPPKEEEKAP